MHLRGGASLREALARWRYRGDRAAPALLRTFATLIAHPGLLTKEYLAGRRTRYLRPLQLFLLCNVLFFFVQPHLSFNLLSTPLRTHMEGLPHSGLATRMVGERIASRGVPFAQYRLVFDTASDHLSRTFVIVMVPLFAAATYVPYRRAMRGFGSHVVFALHFYAFALLAAALLFQPLGWGIARVVALGVGEHLGEFLTEVAPFLVWAVYLYLAVRRVAGEARWIAMLKSVLLTVAVIVVLQVYRLILFLLTFYSV